MTPCHQLQPVPPDKIMKIIQNKNMIREGGSPLDSSTATENI